MKIFTTIKDYFNKKTIERSKRLDKLGFYAVTFPIMLKEGADIDVVYTLQDFVSDPDLYFHEYDERNDFVDSKGQNWTWKYDQINKINLPGIVKSVLTVDDIKKIISNYYKGTNIEQEIAHSIIDVTTIDSLLKIIADRP